jgi:hypothetical protein
VIKNMHVAGVPHGGFSHGTRKAKRQDRGLLRKGLVKGRKCDTAQGDEKARSQGENELADVIAAFVDAIAKRESLLERLAPGTAEKCVSHDDLFLRDHRLGEELAEEACRRVFVLGSETILSEKHLAGGALGKDENPAPRAGSREADGQSRFTAETPFAERYD